MTCVDPVLLNSFLAEFLGFDDGYFQVGVGLGLPGSRSDQGSCQEVFLRPQVCPNL